MQKKTRKLAGGLEKLENVRHDVINRRLDESQYIMKFERNRHPDKKADWVAKSFEKGLTYKELIKGSGLRVKDVLRICGVNPDDCPNLVSELDKFRETYLISR